MENDRTINARPYCCVTIMDGLEDVRAAYFLKFQKLVQDHTVANLKQLNLKGFCHR